MARTPLNVRRSAGGAFADNLTGNADPAWTAVGLTVLLQIGFFYLPLGPRLFHVRLLPGQHFLATIAVVGGPFLILEIEKAFRGRVAALVVDGNASRGEARKAHMKAQ